MLTADLVQYNRRSGKVRPRLIDPTDPDLIELAEAMIGLCAAHEGRNRHDLEEALRDGWPPERPAKLGQGLARLLLGRCRFDVDTEAEPVALRAETVTAAASAWRADSSAGTSEWREAVLDKVAAARGMDSESLQAAMFADLEEHQILQQWEPVSETALLFHYNTAQVQGLLVRSDRLRITAPWPSPQRLRQLFGYLKFFGLLYAVEEGREPLSEGRVSATEGRGELTLVIDGPLSVLDASARYGRQLAQFFPALLLWDQPWRLEAEVRPGKRGEPALLTLGPEPRLRSHYPDRGIWVAEDIARFVTDFNGKPSDWAAEAADVLFSLSGNRPCVPDVTFRHHVTGREVHLEWFPHPDSSRLALRLQDLARAGLDHVIPACRGTPALRPLADADPRLLVLRRRLLPGPVRERLKAFEG